MQIKLNDKYLQNKNTVIQNSKIHCSEIKINSHRQFISSLLTKVYVLNLILGSRSIEIKQN